MKQFFLFLSLFILTTTAAMAQKDDETVHQLVDIMPVLASCAGSQVDAESQRCSQLAIIKHLRDNIKLTQAEMEAGIAGTIHVSFVVTKEGRASQPTIDKGISPGIDQSVKDAVLTLPAFEAGRLHAKPVNTRLAIPIKLSPAN